MVVVSPNVSNFDFKVTLDISQSTPKAIVEDISTYIGAGATNIIGINLKLLSPSNIYFHQSTYPPTVDIYPGLTDKEINIPVFNGEVVWGTYKIYATLIDQDGTQYIWTENGKTYKEVTICKPNTLEFAKGNLGGLGLEPDFDCDTLILTVGDTTPYSYKGQVPIDTVTDIVVSWPTDDTGFIQTVVAEFVPFTMPFSLTGTYDITGTVVHTYQFSETTFVIAGYYYSNTFDVQCQYSLCQALCDYQNLINEVKQCATMSPALAQDKQRKLTIISGLIIEAKLLNGCGVDLGDILEQIRVVGGFECNCNCESKGVTGLALPIGSKVEAGVMCGDISMSVTTVGNIFKVNLSDTSYSMGVEESIQPYVSFGTIIGACSKQFVLSIDFCAAIEALGCGGGGSGTVTSFSAGNLSPLFTTSVATSTTTPALSFSLTNAAANTWFGNNTGIVAAPAYNAAGALSKTDDTNVTLILGGSPTTALLNATSLTLGWTGVLSMARGGTNKALVASAGATVYSDADSLELSSVGTTGQALISGGTGAPTWFAPTVGSVIFAGVSGILQQDNTNFFWDNTNDRLGLGINAALLARLHIKGTTADTSASSFYAENSDSSHSLQYRNDGVIMRDGQYYSMFNNAKANTTWGRNAGNALEASTGNNAAFFGHNAGAATTTGGSNSFFGAGTGSGNTTGSSLTFLGANAGASNTTGTNSIFIGVNTGGTNTDGYCLTLIGTGANVSSTSLNTSIALGQSALVTASNQIVWGDATFFYNQEKHFWSGTGIHSVFYRSSTAEGNQVGSTGDIAYIDTGSAGWVEIKAIGTATNTGWVALGTGSGSGTVTSFSSGNLSPLFTTSVATATTTPALSFTLSTQTANTVFAGPTTGGAAAPTFRALVAADIPDTIGWKIGGNTTTANATIGTNDNFALGIETNGTNRINISNGGNVSIGGTATFLFNVFSGADSYFKVDPANQIILAFDPASGLQFNINGASNLFIAGGNQGIEVNNTTKTTILGDYGNVTNNTKISIDDTATTITHNATLGHFFNQDVSITGKLTVTGAIDPTHMYLDEQVGDPLNVANKGILYVKDVTGVTQLFYEASDATVYQISNAGSGANTALSNLASVSINTSLLAQTGVDLGSTANPFRDIYIFGSGTYSTTYLKLTGTPTGTRTLTIPDATDTIAVLATSQAFTNKSYNGLTLTSTTGTFTLAAAKVLTVSNTITFTATDGSTLAIGAGGTLGSNAYTSTAYAPLASPTFTGTVTIPTPFTLGAVSVTSTGTQLNYLSAATGTTGTTTTNLVYSTSPVLTTPTLGVALATSINGLIISTTTGTFTLTNAKTFAVTNTLTLSGTDSTVMTFPGASDTVAGLAATQIFANKTIIATSNVVEEITAITDSATPTPTGGSLRNAFDVTALAQAAAFAAPSGTPVNWNRLIIRLKDNGTARALTWNSIYVAGGAALPTTTILSKILTLGFIYNTANSLNKWMLVATAQES